MTFSKHCNVYCATLWRINCYGEKYIWVWLGTFQFVCKYVLPWLLGKHYLLLLGFVCDMNLKVFSFPEDFKNFYSDFNLFLCSLVFFQKNNYSETIWCSVTKATKKKQIEYVIKCFVFPWHQSPWQPSVFPNCENEVFSDWSNCLWRHCKCFIDVHMKTLTEYLLCDSSSCYGGITFDWSAAFALQQETP